LDSTSGVRELSANSKTKSVFVTVPEGYVVTAQRGPGFIVHHIHKVTVFGDEEPLSVFIWATIRRPIGKDFQIREWVICSGSEFLGIKKSQMKNGSRTIMAGAVVSLGPSLFGYALPGRGDGHPTLTFF